MERLVYELSLEDIQAIIYALGKLPTDTNVYPLILKIQQQIPTEPTNDISPE
jgi:hypothetical protein